METPSLESAASTEPRRRGRRKGRAKEHTCSECDQSFKRAEHLIRHERSHRKEKPFPCPYCQSFFSRNDLINRHVKKFHPDAPPVQRPRKRRQSPQSTDHILPNGGLDSRTLHNSQEDRSSLDLNGFVGLDHSSLGLMGGFDLLAAVSTLSPDTQFSNVAASMETSEMPVERAWFQFNWFSDFFKDLTEAASSENLLQRKVPPLEALVSLSGDSDFCAANRCKPVEEEDVLALQQRLVELDQSKKLPADFTLPSHRKINRYLMAFFGYFCPHTPIVHTQSFEFSTFSPPTLLSILAVGAIYANERETGDKLHEISKMLIGNYEERVKPSSFQNLVFELQGRILNIQYGLFSGIERLVNHALTSFPTVERVIREGLLAFVEAGTWETWVQIETFKRACFWMMIQTSVYLMFSDESVGIANLKEFKCDMPCSNELWEATKAEWLVMTPQEPVWFPSMLATILEGNPIHNDNVSSFALLALLAAILIQIATYERLNWYKAPCTDPQWAIQMQNTLHAWEDTWKRHPHANPNPYSSPHGPIMADTIPLVNTAYFHIFVPRLLQRIKDNLIQQQLRAPMTREEFSAILMPQSETEREMMFRAATHAAHSLSVRAKLGFGLVARTACLDMGFHYGYTGFESAMILSSWNWVINNSPERPGEEALRDIISDILQEMDEQMGFKESPAVAPLETVQKMMSVGWVWRYQDQLRELMLIHEDNLRRFA